MECSRLSLIRTKVLCMRSYESKGTKQDRACMVDDVIFNFMSETFAAGLWLKSESLYMIVIVE